MYTNTQQPNTPQLDQLRSELPTYEASSGGEFKPTHGGVGSLPGGRDESGVARLPEESALENRNHNYTGTQPNTNTVPGAAQPLRNDYPNDTARAQEVSRQQEPANASIPGTRTYGGTHTGLQSNKDTVLGTAQPLRNDYPHDTTRAQEVSKQQEPANVSIPGTRTYDGNHTGLQSNKDTDPSTVNPPRNDYPPDTAHASRQQEPASGTRTYDGSHHRQSDQAPSHTEQVEGDTGADQKPSLGQRVKQGIKNMTTEIKKV